MVRAETQGAGAEGAVAVAGAVAGAGVGTVGERTKDKRLGGSQRNGSGGVVDVEGLVAAVKDESGKKGEREIRGRATKDVAKKTIVQRSKEQKPETNEEERHSIIPHPPLNKPNPSPSHSSESTSRVCSKSKPIMRSTCPYLTKRYLTLQEIVLFIGEVKLEILCEDGWHYHVNFLKSGPSMVLHFPHWNQRHDIITNEDSIMEYYLSYRGMYSINDGSSTDMNQTTPKVSKPFSCKRANDEEVRSAVKKVKTSRKTTETRESDDTYLTNTPPCLQQDLAPISPNRIPIGWIGEAVRRVCLGSSTSLNSAAGKYTELLTDMTRLELLITSHQKRINEIDIQVMLQKSRIPLEQIVEIPSLSSRADWLNNSFQLNPQLWLQEKEKQPHFERVSNGRDQTALLEEKIQRLEKIDAARREIIVLSRDKDVTLNFLVGNAMEILRSKIREEIETFLFEREEHRPK